MSGLPTGLGTTPSGRARPVWFDAAAYGRAKLLGGEDVPWATPAELTSFYAKLGGMFHSDAVLVDLEDIFAQRAAADEQLRLSMAARSRPGYPLRTLLADGQARATAAEAVHVLAATSRPVPVVLTLPTPGRWLVAAAQLAGFDPGPPDPGQAETAAMYIADLLRLFAEAGVGGLLLEEGPVSASELIDPEAYRPILNVAGHYTWPVLLRTDVVAAWPKGPVVGVAAWLAPAGPVERGNSWGLLAGSGFWEGAEPDEEADLVLVAVPADADPEPVMKRIRALA